jgi:hypothetical protein
MSEAPWTGEDRRKVQASADTLGISLAIINYVDQRVAKEIGEVRELLRQHIVQEDKQYAQVLASLASTAKASEDRHHALVDQLTLHMGRQERVEAAFVKNDDGHPDFHGHRHDHTMRMKTAAWWASVKDKSITKLLEWSLVAVAAWGGVALWKSFLQGPA